MSARKTLGEGGYGALEGGKGSFRDVLRNKEEAAMLEQEKRVVKTEDRTPPIWINEIRVGAATEPNDLKLARNAGGTLHGEKTV